MTEEHAHGGPAGAEIAHGPPEALARLFSPEAQRTPLAALDDWRRELRELAVSVRDPGVARVKLRWWTEETERTLGGNAQHPASEALARAWPTDTLPREAMLGFVRAATVEVEGGGFRDWEALADHAADTEGGFFAAAMILAGADPEAAEAAGRHLGLSVHLHRVLDRLPDDLRRERLHLPRSVMGEHGIRRGDLRPDRPRAPLYRLLEEVLVRSCSEYVMFQGEAQALPAEARVFPTVAGRLHQLELAAWARRGPAVLDTGWTRPGPLRRLLAAWAGARAARKGRIHRIERHRFPRPGDAGSTGD